MDPSLMPPEELEARRHIAIGKPRTRAAELMHEEWHRGEIDPGAPKTCGSIGCGYSGRLLAVEVEAAPTILEAVDLIAANYPDPPATKARLLDALASSDKEPPATCLREGMTCVTQSFWASRQPKCEMA